MSQGVDAVEVKAVNLYSRLDGSQIRLFRFDGHDGETLQCSLQIFDLNSICPDFRALSYTWGSATYPTDNSGNDDAHDALKSITCNGVERSITENTFDALAQLRKESSTETYYWVDAICINQDDLQERSQQVHLMGEIYAAAELVIIWLGATQLFMEDFVWATETLLPKLDALTTEPGYGDIYSHPPNDPMVGERLGEANLIRKLLGFCKFCGSCRWFDRAWVLQEVVRARQLELRCGEARLSWHRATRVCEHLRTSGWEFTIRGQAQFLYLDQSFGYDGTEFTKKNALRDLCNETSGATLPTEMIETFEWLFGAADQQALAVSMMVFCAHSIQTFQCSDDRDKVFAVLGLVNRYFPNGTKDIFTADYHSSVESVYQRFTTLAVRSLPLLNVLSYVADPSTRKLSSLPSWVPDFSTSPKHELLNFLAQGGIFSPVLLPNIPRMARRIENYILYCNGVSKDVVEHVCKSLVEEMEIKPNIEDFLEICSHMPIESCGINRVECLWRTLVADSFGASHPAPADTALNFAAVMTTFGSFEIESSLYGNTIPDEQLALLLQSLDPGGKSVMLPTIQDIQAHRDKIVTARASHQAGNPDARLIQEVRALDALALPYLKQMQHCHQRRLFVTRKGYLGLGPPSSQPGDHVYYIHEASVPFILRPRSEKSTYSLIGECYVHGRMHGELLEEAFDTQESVHEIGLV